jgi:hypothetical protein
MWVPALFFYKKNALVLTTAMLTMKAYQRAGKDGSDGSGEVVVDPANQHMYWIIFKNVNNYHGSGNEINIMMHFIIFITIFE